MGAWDKQHEHKMAKKIKYECPNCGRMFDSREERDKHVEEEHWKAGAGTKENEADS